MEVWKVFPLLDVVQLYLQIAADVHVCLCGRALDGGLAGRLAR